MTIALFFIIDTIMQCYVILQIFFLELAPTNSNHASNIAFACLQAASLATCLATSEDLPWLWSCL